MDEDMIGLETWQIAAFWIALAVLLVFMVVDRFRTESRRWERRFRGERVPMTGLSKRLAVTLLAILAALFLLGVAVDVLGR
jgi:hypothetical protein